jgi:hypothetical protein
MLSTVMANQVCESLFWVDGLLEFLPDVRSFLPFPGKPKILNRNVLIQVSQLLHDPQKIVH